MTEKEPLLSICIPTYNREKYLKRLLDSVVCQKEFKDTDDVDIVVDDGPSSDNTESMVKEYIKKYWNKIKYYRNPVRIWMCPAFLEALDYWTWKYLRLFGSDNVMGEHALKTVLNAIKSTYPKTVMMMWCKNKNNFEMILNFNWFSDFSSYLWTHKRDALQYEWWLITFCTYCCLENSYYKQWKAFLEKIWNVDNETLKYNYFNFNLIKYFGLFGVNSISFVESPELVILNSDDAESSRTINFKILRDLNMLIDFINDNYVLTLNSKKVFFKIKLLWIIALLVKPLKKVLHFLKLEKYYFKMWSKFRKTLNQ